MTEAQSVTEPFPHHGWGQGEPAGRRSCDSSQGIGRRGSHLRDNSAQEQSSIQINPSSGTGVVAGNEEAVVTLWLCQSVQLVFVVRHGER
eukprot:scaffold263723_cov15-Tisochrysis_lutea.AAC.1